MFMFPVKHLARKELNVQHSIRHPENTPVSPNVMIINSKLALDHMQCVSMIK